MTNLINPNTVTLDKESDGLWFTPEGDYVVQRTHEEGRQVYAVYRRVNDEIVEPKWGPDCYFTLQDARHDIALERFHKSGGQVPDGTDGPSQLADMFPIGGSR